ncbi:MAG: tyrosine-protein phosphatase [Acidocella sp.]|nr:tyrosine-protein phosphatase [Acidocella sp.]
METVQPKARYRVWLDALFVDHGLLRILWTNFHVVKPQVLYRSNHPTPGNLKRFVRQAGIKTIINLRGRTTSGADTLSREAAHKIGLDFLDVPMRSSAAPKREAILQLAEAFRTMRKPALVHCKSGADRAGFAAAIFWLLEGESPARAKTQLALRYGHLKYARAGILDKFIDAWAESEGKKPFLDWVAEDYDAAALQAAFKSNLVARFLNDRILRRE